MTKKTAVVICPGRGTYGKAELGYLQKYHKNKKHFLGQLDFFRAEKGQMSIQELDAFENFSIKDHIPGENSASLIYGCSYSDYLDINTDKFDIVAITGNSMGWYIAAACAGALDRGSAINIINTMGSSQKDGLIGGQIVYPVVNTDWTKSESLNEILETKLKSVNLIPDHEAYISIHFGGLKVIGGNDLALKWLLKNLPPEQDRYPFRLPGNAAFHTPLLKETSDHAKTIMGAELLSAPKIPLIDGTGKIWQPYSTRSEDIWDYTLGSQVYDTYDFSKSIEVAIKEFAPDHLIITGPGMTLGGAVAQSLIKNDYKGLKNKEDFKQIQIDNPYVLAMADPKQRQLVL